MAAAMSLMMALPEMRVASASPEPLGMAARSSASEGVLPSMPSWRILAWSGFAACQALYVACHAS